MIRRSEKEHNEKTKIPRRIRKGRRWPRWIAYHGSTEETNFFARNISFPQKNQETGFSWWASFCFVYYLKSNATATVILLNAVQWQECIHASLPFFFCEIRFIHSCKCYVIGYAVPLLRINPNWILNAVFEQTWFIENDWVLFAFNIRHTFCNTIPKV